MIRLVASTAGTAALLFGAGAAHGQTAPADAAPQLASREPVALFRAVCIDGIAKLSRTWATSVTYSMLPPEAKAAVGKTELANPGFQIGGGKEYLLLPAPASGPPFSDSCAVVWEGNNFAEAQKLTTTASDNFTVTATATKGWIMLATTPKPAPPPAPPPAH